MAAFGIVGVIGLRFMAGEARHFHEQHEELKREHQAKLEAAERAPRRSRPGDRNGN